MEYIYRFKKRMVYPEQLNLDQISTTNNSKHIAQHKSTTNWCSEPLQANHNVSNQSTDGLGSSVGVNGQFIQDRIRHLVDAFSTRAQVARECMDTPATPSSVSSHDTAEPASSSPKSKLSISFSDKYEEGDVFESLTNRAKRKAMSPATIDPNGKTYCAWMSIAALSVLYNAWVIPLRSTFPSQTADNRPVWMTFDYLADLIYAVDMVLVQPRVRYLHEGFWVTDLKLLRQKYVKTKHFKWDLVSLLPLDLLYFVFGPECVALRLPRFLKMHTFWTFFSFVDKLLANPHIIRITRTLLYMMYLIHLNACAYYAFSEWQGIGSNNFVFNGEGSAYIKCFYFATKTATSIGKNPKPTQEVEYMFMTFSWLLGVFVFALLIGQIRDIFSTATRSKSEYRKLVDETLEYMRRLNIPQDMQRRVQLWFNYTWETQHTLDENMIMDCLPHKMKTDIAINVHMQTLNKVKLFADCDLALLRELVLQLKSVIYLPGDVICKKGDVGKEMYILQSGKVQVIGSDGRQVLATLSEGSVFGEISLLGIAGMNRRTADVRSQGYSNLFVLSKADLNAALSHYPEAQELLNKKAKLLMKKNAAMERKQNAMIIINNPQPNERQAKLLDTVLQIMPADSKTNQLLRFGSRGKSCVNEENNRFKSRQSLPIIDRHGDSGNTIETKATVHRTMS